MLETRRDCHRRSLARSEHLIFRSLSIEVHSSRESVITPYVAGGEYSAIARLNAYTWRGDSVTYAKDRGLPIDYIDNCWSRAAMSGSDLRPFLQMGAASARDAADLLRSVDDLMWYVIKRRRVLSPAIVAYCAVAAPTQLRWRSVMRGMPRRAKFCSLSREVE